MPPDDAVVALDRAMRELVDAEWQVAQIERAVANGLAPAHSLVTARWWEQECSKRVEQLSGEVSSDAS